MTKNLSYDTLVIVEAHLEQNLKELDREIFSLQKTIEGSTLTPDDVNLQHRNDDRKELAAALEEVKAYDTYIANYVH